MKARYFKRRVLISLNSSKKYKFNHRELEIIKLILFIYDFCILEYIKQQSKKKRICKKFMTFFLT